MAHEERSVEIFKRFLRIRSISGEGPKGAYQEAATFLSGVCKDMGLDTWVHEYVPGKPVVVARWTGEQPELPALLLNSHYDVVPVMLEHWTKDPFAAEEQDGWIYARGTQDMKCVTIQHIEAVRRLREAGYTPRRTVWLSFVPDEEIGGADGLAKLVDSEFFRDTMRVGAALDEGLANAEDKYTVFYGERALWWVKLRATGPTGHASRFIKDTAMQKLVNVVNKFLAFRAEQEAQLDCHGCKHAVAHKLGDVTTLNLTMLRGGVSADGGKTFALNVIPMEAEAGFDIRIPPSVPLEEFEARMREWVASEEGVHYSFVFHTPAHGVSSTDPAHNPYWAAFQRAMEEVGTPVELEVFPAATDSRYLRAVGVPAFGFSPMKRTPVLLHDHDERLQRSVFLQGIGVFETVLRHMTADYAAST